MAIASVRAHVDKAIGIVQASTSYLLPYLLDKLMHAMLPAIMNPATTIMYHRSALLDSY